MYSSYNQNPQKSPVEGTFNTLSSLINAMFPFLIMSLLPHVTISFVDDIYLTCDQVILAVRNVYSCAAHEIHRFYIGIRTKGHIGQVNRITKYIAFSSGSSDSGALHRDL